MKQADNWHLTEDIDHQLGRGDPFAAAVRATRMPMVITDPQQHDNPIVFVNQAFQTLTGYDREEIIGRNCRFLQGRDTNPDTVRRVREAIAQGGDVDVDLLNYRKDGTTFWNALFLSPVRNEDGTIRYYFASQMDVTDRVEAQQRIADQKAQVDQEVARQTRDLKAALEAKTVLLHEVDHRVKNNLLMIGSLIRLQMRTIGDPTMAAKLNAMLDRINAMASVHRQLYQSADISQFEVGGFVQAMVEDIVAASGREDITTRAEIAAVRVPAELASPLALIVNEVVTNAIKHGFAGNRPGCLDIAVAQESTTGTITIGDDGAGLSPAAKPDGLGRVLINRLAKQVEGTVEWLDGHPGTRVRLAFPIAESQS